jgi:hypothetical protein
MSNIVCVLEHGDNLRDIWTSRGKPLSSEADMILYSYKVDACWSDTGTEYPGSTILKPLNNTNTNTNTIYDRIAALIINSMASLMSSLLTPEQPH